MRNFWNLGTAFMALAFLGAVLPHSASAQGKTFKGANYAITFPTGWDSVQTGKALAKYGGLGGMATLGAEAGSTLPNVDSLSVSLADSLGGTLKKDSSGIKTLGKYEVHWQKFAYDSLPKLSATVSAAAGFKVNLKNGSFRVYYLVADGVAFTIAGMAIISGGEPPYKEIEKALESLRLGAQAGIVPVSRIGGRDLWIRDGRLGGSWLKTNQVFAVECFDARGSFLGSAAHGTEGAWILPVARQDMIVRLRTAEGSGLHFIVRP